MVDTYPNLLRFYGAYRTLGDKPHIGLSDIDALVEELESRGIHAFIRPDDSVDVFVKREYSGKYWPQKRYHRKHYAKITASFDRELVARFSKACKSLGVTQASLLAPVMEDAVRRAGIPPVQR
jgi:hypothetical protein